MKTLKYLILLWLFSLLAVRPLYSQPFKDDCKELLVQYVKDMAKITKPVKNKVYRLKYTFETINKPGSPDKNISVAADMILAADKSSFESNVISMYADSKNGFMILPHQRQVIWGPGGNAGYTEDNFKMISAFQDSLIRYSKLISCTGLKGNGGDLKQIILEVPSNIQNRFFVERLMLIYSNSKKQIVKVVQYFNDQSPMDKMIVNYEEMDFDYNKKGDFNAYNKVLTASGKLRPEYKGFELIDNRDKN
ncbi:MAG TPA: hypothetical protein PKD91_00010 [Bacteroidia bacterium]|nr:hypothetical protein [Bacteroidia bacterium]